MKKPTMKKFALMIMFLLSFSFVLTGCSLFTTNMNKYNNTVVATVEYEDGEKLEINKRELIVAFNNYGANLVNQGSSVKDALNQTLDQLIKQKVLIKQSENTSTYSNADKNKLWKDTLDSVETYLETYTEKVEKDWEIKRPIDTNLQEEATVKYSPYQKKVELVSEDGELVLRYIEQEEELEEELQYSQMAEIEDKDAVVSVLYNVLKSKSTFTSTNEELTIEEKYERQNARVFAEAVKRLTTDLKKSEKGLGLSTDNESVLKRALEKMYVNALDNLKLTKISKVVTPTSEFSKITVSNVLDKYTAMVGESYQKYKYNSAQFDTDVLGSFSSINYTQSEDYFFVSHILLKFSVEQQAEYDALEARYERGEISPLEKQSLTDALINEIVAVERDADGKIVEDGATLYANDILDEIVRKLNAATTDEQKAEEFRKLLYKYNQDDGALNSEYLYVIGEEKSQMVETFTEAARTLHNNGAGAFGSVSSLVPSQYGVHIVFYAGAVAHNSPFIATSLDDFHLSQNDIWVLNDTLLNPLSNKTLLDKVYDTLVEKTYQGSQQMFLNTLMQDLKITKITSAYKDLLK